MDDSSHEAQALFHLPYGSIVQKLATKFFIGKADLMAVSGPCTWAARPGIECRQAGLPRFGAIRSDNPKPGAKT